MGRVIAGISISATLLALGCSGGGNGDPLESGCRIDDWQYEIDEYEINHACSHVDEGPFGEVGADKTLANLHMIYTVRLTDSGDDTYRGEVRFRARRTSPHVFYYPEDVYAAYQGEDGSNSCLAASVFPASCPGLGRADVIDLTEQQTVSIQLGPTERQNIRIMVEAK
ncbi:hypothetical protein [Chondromyces crocatus]|uniref:Lipoprotein n=1 Tax=Chondromyces crocatus TaxID=52 RepID=A0A0K1EFF6_CHOCO|nr:hypothetical protein [Chondromyces crocatus]AKT39437.1 uncharacterized protein CMC5_035840 [Chondromyces crocatus]